MEWNEENRRKKTQREEIEDTDSCIEEDSWQIKQQKMKEKWFLSEDRTYS
jgi:hypothetical protein